MTGRSQTDDNVSFPLLVIFYDILLAKEEQTDVGWHL